MATLSAYRTRITNSLHDTVSKYSNDILDESLRKALNEYTRAFPNIDTQEITVSTAGRSQSAATCANLMSIIQLVHPYNAALADPFACEREDFVLTWQDGSPHLYFTGEDIPQVDEIIFVRFAAKQLIEDLDAAAATTVRDDHEDLLIVGAAGLAAMMRASGLNEQWGARPGEMSALMLWGSRQYQQFQNFLVEIRTEQTIDIFPKTHWQLDEWDE
jgi:hypothetical protein